MPTRSGHTLGDDDRSLERASGLVQYYPIRWPRVSRRPRGLIKPIQVVGGSESAKGSTEIVAEADLSTAIGLAIT